MSEKRQLIVIGAGPGGYTAAFHAADIGLNVTLIDTEKNPGGVCLYKGCIPSKALLHAAKVITEAEEASEFGVSFGKPEINTGKLRDWKNDVVKKLTGGLGQLTKQRKVEYIQGTAKFINKNTLEVKRTDGTNEEISFENVIIATGSSPASIPNLNFSSDKIMFSTEALELNDVPGKLLIIGGGYIGLELGTVYASLGSKVCVVEMLPGLLNGADRDFVTILSKRLNTNFEKIMLKTRVTEIKEEKNGILVKFENDKTEKTEELYNKVLISTGRKPNSKNLGLENTKVVTDKRGFINTDSQKRTSENNIYAIGDVAGEPMLAHKASHEAIAAVEAIAGKKTIFEPVAIPAVVFTDPEIAWCGLTEDDAKQKSLDVKIMKFPWAASGRALSLKRTDGLTKIIADKATGRILGAGIAGPGAGELISECVLAMEMGANATDLMLTIHPHPTLSETIMEAAEMFDGQSTHLFKKT